jgi:transaldolase
MPEPTLLAYADHGKLSGELPASGGDAEALLAEFVRSGVQLGPLAADLQREGARAFAKSWHDLLACLASKSVSLARADPAAAR